MFKKATLQVLGLTGALVAGGAMVGFVGGPEHDHVAKVGERAPDFTLVDLEGVEHTLSEYTADGQTVVLEWFNPTCPFVRKHYADSEHQTMNQTIKEFKDQKVVWLRVNSGSERSRTSGVDKNKAAAEEWNMTTPILLDAEGEVGQAYGAKRTPELYVIDTDGVLRYHGAIDSDNHPKRFGDEVYVKTAIQQVLAGETVTTTETQAYGCAIKYKN